MSEFGWSDGRKLLYEQCCRKEEMRRIMDACAGAADAIMMLGAVIGSLDIPGRSAPGPIADIAEVLRLLVRAAYNEGALATESGITGEGPVSANLH